jgi:tetratricopeptide (TPR) repeat protein
MMGDNDPRGNPWGMPGDMQWGEVGVAATPAQQDPSPAERDFIASLETAHAPAIPSMPPNLPNLPMPPGMGMPPGVQAAAPGLAPTDERDFIASLETAHAPALPLPASPTSQRRSQAPRELRVPREARAPHPLATAPVLGGIVRFWETLRPVLAEPFPRNLVLGVGIAPFVALLVGFILQAVLAGGDWSHGGLAAGVDALLLAGAVAAGSGVRYWVGRRSAAYVKLASALVLGLVIMGAGSLALSHLLHYIQGQAAERTGAYALAVTQYKLYGEVAPNAPDVARADTEWGEQLIGQKHYAAASRALSEALAANPKDTALMARASKDLYNVYSTWLSGGGVGMPYGDAATFFASYRTSSACDASCQTTAGNFEAQTRLLAGAQLAAVGNFAQAVIEFDTIQAQFPNTDSAAQAHTTGAKVYLAYGQQLLSDPNTCKGAVSGSQTLAQQYQTLIVTFQTLTSKYGDTPEGQQGVKLMAAPQPVNGTLTGYPSAAPTPSIHLSKTVNQSTLYFSNNYNSAVDAKSGAFGFSSVTPGDYNLHTERDLGYKVEIHIIHSASGNLYNIHVGALCPLNLGNVPY